MLIFSGRSSALLVWKREHGVTLAVTGEKDAIEVEERRMFNFLHGLGIRYLRVMGRDYSTEPHHWAQCGYDRAN